MDQGYTSAIEPPRARVEPELGRRRHRRLTAPAGVLLFACLFLPAVRGCEAPVYPLEMPMFAPPYFYGMALACAALATTARTLRVAITALRVVTLAAVAGSVMLIVVSPGLGIVEVAATAALLATIGVGGYSERRAALLATVVGAICTLWFGLWASSRDAMIGVYLSTVGAVGLLTGGLVWLGDLATPHRD